MPAVPVEALLTAYGLYIPVLDHCIMLSYAAYRSPLRCRSA